MWFGCYLGEAGLAGGRERLGRELDQLQHIGATNVRLLAGSEASKLAGAIARGIRRSADDYDEELLRGLDFCLAEMARRDMRAILFLSNFWQWSGGFAQYVNWATNRAIPDPDLPTVAAGDWRAFMQMSAQLYDTAAANELYLNYAAKLINRRNTVNGRAYSEDPTIMTWELANEPRPGTDDAAERVPLFAQWVDRTSRFIKERAPRHLVCTGSEGVWGCLQKEDAFLRVHGSAAVDYVTVHMWLKNWGWLKVAQLGPEFEEAATKARDHVEMHTRLATDNLRKPLVLEEFGLPRDHERYEPGTSTAARDAYFERMFNQVAESCAAGRALQGANFWAWGGEGRANSSSGYTAASLMGDPFCEPQGLNSVYHDDTSTLKVIANANAKLRRS